MKLFWVLQVDLDGARCFSPFFQLFFFHPFKVSRRQWFAHCPTVKVLCVKVCQVFVWFVRVVLVTHVRVVCHSMFFEIIDTPPCLPFSKNRYMSGSDRLSNFISVSLNKRLRRVRSMCNTMLDQSCNCPCMSFGNCRKCQRAEERLFWSTIHGIPECS